jgi:hypothetical protein
MDWDDDHLYAFCLNGERWDDRYLFNRRFDEEEDPPFADEVAIGELGLVPGHKFLYVFDFGDNHRFTIRVKGSREEAGGELLPRLVDRAGEPPPQYPGW